MSRTESNFLEIFLENAKTKTFFPTQVSVVYLARDDLLVDLDGLVGKEGRVASCHLVHEDAQCPPVNRLVVALHSAQQG
jgi:hypothetical protein